MSLNNCCFTGRLGADIEVRATSAGKQIGKLSLAVKDRKDTTWVRLTFFDPPAGLVPYLTKGAQIAVSARYTEDKWTNKDGVEVRSANFIVNSLDLLGDKKDDAAPVDKSSKGKAKTTHTDDEIPF